MENMAGEGSFPDVSGQDSISDSFLVSTSFFVAWKAWGEQDTLLVFSIFPFLFRAANVIKSLNSITYFFFLLEEYLFPI